MFPITKHYMPNEMGRGSKKAGAKRIRIHNLCHSHVSLLINMGFTPVVIGNRVGRESSDITFDMRICFPVKGN